MAAGTEISNHAEISSLAEKESIDWRKRRTLIWTDFKAAPVPSAQNAALTSTSILINYNYSNKKFTYKLQCVFYPGKSWARSKTPRILSHEQGHFDISQLFTRKLNKALSDYRVNTHDVDTIDKEIMAIYQRIAADQTAYQLLYDKETNYSRDAAGQQSWEKRIEAELTEWEKFGNYPE